MEISPSDCCPAWFKSVVEFFCSRLRVVILRAEQSAKFRAEVPPSWRLEKTLFIRIRVKVSGMTLL